MKSQTKRWLCLAGLVVAAAFTGGCDDLVRRSVRDGVFSYISGGLSSSLNQGGSLNSLLNDLLTGGLFGGATNNTGS